MCSCPLPSSSERIRDKIAASKRKGIWVGGNLPLGYEMKDGKMAFLLGRVVSTYASAAALSRAAPDNAHQRVMFDLALCTSLHALCGLADR